MNDTYGSQMRERMKMSMARPAKWQPTNRRKTDSYDKFISYSSFMLAVIIAVLLSLEVTVQIMRRFHV